MLAAWVDAWAEAGALAEVDAAADPGALAAEVARREAESTAACHQLVEVFCRRAGQRPAGRGPV